MKDILEHLFQHKTLTKNEAKQILIDIASGKFHSYQISSFLTAFIMRNITLQELIGFREALLDLCLPIDLSSYNPIDLCGTGGDGKNTFNVSTLSSFVVAASGIPVAKHGNYGVSSVSGSSNVLEYLGISFQKDEDILRRQIEEANICFLHAPLFHPAMKEVAPIRKELKVKTFFNMLGPLVNPARIQNQIVGVFSLELARMYQYILQKEHATYSILYNLDGYDEITLTDACKVITPKGETIYTPSQLGFKKWKPKDVWGGNSLEESARIFWNILHGEGTKAQTEVVIANSAFAIHTYSPKLSLEDAKEQAKEVLFNGKALSAFQTLKKTQ